MFSRCDFSHKRGHSHPNQSAFVKQNFSRGNIRSLLRIFKEYPTFPYLEIGEALIYTHNISSIEALRV